MRKVIFLLVATTALSAGAWNAPSGGFASGTVAWIQQAGDGSFFFTLLSGGTNPNLCAAGPVAPAMGVVANGTAGVTADGQRALLATLTAAMLAGKTVKVYANSGVSRCEVGAIEVY